MDNYKILISGDYNVFNEGWNNAGVYMCSGNYISDTFKLPIYVGSSVNLQNRIEDQHILQLKRNKHEHNPILQYSWNKYSEKEGFIWYLLETCEPEKTLEREQFYLDLYTPFVRTFGGFNIAENAIGWKKGNIPWNKGIKRPEMTGEKHPLFGIHWTDEQKKKHSQILKNKYFSGELSSGFKGKFHSEETRRKISMSNTGKRKRFLTKQQRKVLCVETGKIYDSSWEIERELKLICSNIIRSCKYNKTCGGYHWQFVKE